jgi:hypothetical protein
VDVLRLLFWFGCFRFVLRIRLRLDLRLKLMVMFHGSSAAPTSEGGYCTGPAQKVGVLHPTLQVGVPQRASWSGFKACNAHVIEAYVSMPKGCRTTT